MPLTPSEAAAIAAAWSPMSPTMYWVPAKHYRPGDVVLWDNAAWIALEASADSVPTSLNPDWSQILTPGSGGLTGSGTMGTMPAFTASTALGDGHIEDDGDGNLVLTGDATLTLTTLTVDDLAGSGDQFVVSDNAGLVARLPQGETSDIVIGSVTLHVERGLIVGHEEA